jgi:hypothetical protein
MMKEINLEALVERQLRGAKLKYLKEPVVGATRPDFLVTTDRGDQIVIDVKDWKASAENTARAIHQAQRYKELSKAAAALIVTAIAAPVFAPGAAVVPVSLLLAHLSQVTTGLTRTKRSRTSVTTRSSPNKKIFASMPFKDRYDDTFLVAIQPAALALNAVADRFDYAASAITQNRPLIIT